MNPYTNLIVLNGEPVDDIVSCDYDRTIKKQRVVFKGGKTYNYNYNNVLWLKEPSNVDTTLYEFSNQNGVIFYDIKDVIEFKDGYNSYYRFFFKDGTYRSYNGRALHIEKNTLANIDVKILLNYYKQVSEIIGLKDDDGTNILEAHFEKMQFLRNATVLSKFLNASTDNSKQLTSNETVVFPFGCNLSQINAIYHAVNNQISIIEGPSGTGKTQTILNIIANVVMRGYTVAVVSNNNSATDNVFEKLRKYGFDYIAAQLGSTKNKRDFIASKQLPYPDFSQTMLSDSDQFRLMADLKLREQELIKMLENQNKVAELRRDLSALEIEKKYFDEYFDSTYEDRKIFRNKGHLTSEKVLWLWNESQDMIEGRKKISIWSIIKIIFLYGFKGLREYYKTVSEEIPYLKKKFYELKCAELGDEIKELQDSLSKYKFNEKMSELTEVSAKLLRSELAKKYMPRGQRIIFDEDALWKNTKEFLLEYPVILSTTYSARSSLKGITYDYVIVDESSQVDLVTGVLAMSCARNIVIVGDLKQLPNVITREDKLRISSISERSSIPAKYRYEENSLLSSVCETFMSAPKTLLREHYRCHPKIIEFCNQKFYNNQLIIMTEDKGEQDVLKVYVTSEGNHARGHMNQRQIDEIKMRILPELSSNDVGIITPYKAQTSALVKELQSDITISTVHKFQGRETDDIIISTVDNEISDFTDDPNMLNVAISRAKNRLRLVISDHEKNEKTNIGDLVKYIEYNNFEIKKSDIFSVFDMLYKSFELSRKRYLEKYKRVSQYDSENLMSTVIIEVLDTDEFSKLSVVIHQPLNRIIRDPYKLSDEEIAYAMNPLTHVDFLIYSKIDKSPILVIEVDGYMYHKEGTRQSERDGIKNVILEKYGVPFIRLSTTGSGEKERLKCKLRDVIS